jgi:hypothetical protein
MSNRAITRIAPGTWVKVSGFVPGLEATFHFVPDREVDDRQNKVTTHGALAYALIGAKIGDKVRLEVEGHEVELVVLDFGSDDVGRESTNSPAEGRAQLTASTPARKDAGRSLTG